ncbi:hypothetical protein L226DRAFT_610659 [Lentinus tigrinus ALCF2SS1-7]|uniref:F-box domain-containing protein n=1 Tax=Lentinus tigrinus ALCF2SS1-6 TaxID=1328759 RepID=A0A5C2S2H0_9APHY|nr:hypothetical protein L227DRAFT_655467 [Lentinus tigrinus ALCF2SS1-6]RPD78829.1 hypothetical protein L226DRAFT_610659 [Lentinus tigrinus ALCF2SS1-7]
MPPKKRTKTMHSENHVTASKAPKKEKGDPATPVARGRNIRCRRGGLQDMPKMPLDVLFEIFSFLHPQDLLNLSRTTKDFRSCLMSRSSARYWEQSRKQVEGLPDKPIHLSEPAYANLVFCNHCHNCLKSGSHVTAYWDIYARYCGSCRTEVFTSTCDEAFKPVWLEFDVRSCDIVVTVRLNSDRLRGIWYHKPELEKIKQEWKSLANKTQKTQYIQDRTKFVSQSREISRHLEKWQVGLKRRAVAESNTVKETRYETVLAKLRQEGWSEELDRMDKVALNGLSRIDGVSRATKLTDKGWMTIRPPVVEYMQKFKSQRINKERANLLSSRLWYLKQAMYAYQHEKWPADCKDRVYVGFADCAYMPEVRAVIENTSPDLTKEDVKQQLKEVLPGLIDGWVEKQRTELVAIIHEELKKETQTVQIQDPLQLAMASFRCGSSFCRATSLRWPQIAEHRCSYAMCKSDKSLYGQCVESRRERHTADMRIPETKRFGIYARSEWSRDIIRLCGFDPETVTYPEMDACIVRLVCRRCSTYARQEVFDWKGAITHDEAHSDSKPLPGRWMLLSEEHAAKARALEVAIAAKSLDLDQSRQDTFHCGWCGYDGSMSRMYEHLRDSHGKSRSESKLDQDFYLVERYKPSIWMYSEVFSECKSEKDTVAAGKGFFASF